MDPLMRRQAFKDLLGYAGTVGVTMGLAMAAGAKVGTSLEGPDKEHPDRLPLGTVAFGDHRFDLTGGLEGRAKLAFKLSKDLISLNPKKAVGEFLGWDDDKKAVEPLHGGYLAQHLAPVPSAGASYLMGRNVAFSGNKQPPFTGTDALKQAIAPMVLQDMYEGWRDSGFGGAALAAAFPGMEKTYKQHAPSTAPQKTKLEQTLSDKVKVKYGNEPIPDDKKAQFDAENKVVDSLRKGDSDTAGKAWQEGVEKGMFAPNDPKHIERLKDRAQMSDLEYTLKYKMNKIDDALDAFNDPDASKEERQKIASIVVSKWDNYAKELSAGKVPARRAKEVQDKIEKAKSLGIADMAGEKSQAATAK